MELVRKWAALWAEDYMTATKKQARCHQQFALAQDLVGDVRPVGDHITRSRYIIPASHHIPLLRGATREEGFIPALMSADRLSLTAQGARTALARSGHELLGDWPL